MIFKQKAIQLKTIKEFYNIKLRVNRVKTVFSFYVKWKQEKNISITKYIKRTKMIDRTFL